MRIAGLILVGLIAALHIYIAYFEIFAWETRGPVVFADFPPELFPQTTTLALNQGVYNAFLALGLIWSLLIPDRKWQLNIATCFLLFVAIAGTVGALTAAPRIFFVQALPAIVTLALLLFANRRS